jgi:preprotein translocase subunit SecA
MDYLREGISLRAYGQRDPLIEYKQEAFQMFQEMNNSIRDEAVEVIFKIQPVRPERFKGVFSSINHEFVHPESTRFKDQQEPSVREASLSSLPPERPLPVKSEPKVGRNDPCPCGSGKKYKKCCGR